MQIFPLSDSILLPLTPTIGGTIAKYLQRIVREFCINLPQNCDNAIAKPPDYRSALLPVELPLRRVPTSPYQYVSAIAYSLAAKLSSTPLEICQLLQQQTGKLEQAHPAEALEISCWYNNAGYIYFQLSPRSISTWLNYIRDLDRHPDRVNGFSRRHRSPSISTLAPTISLYAHARCCSLLSLASTEKLVSIDRHWQMTAISRSSDERDRGRNRSTTEPMLIFEEPAEERLIHALMDVLDAIYTISETDCLVVPQAHRWASELAIAWLEFYRDCRIFGAPQRQNPRLAIARCGLTAISRHYLQVLLEEYLGVIAPMEL
jgi:hypothetical protein